MHLTITGNIVPLVNNLIRAIEPLASSKRISLILINGKHSLIIAHQPGIVGGSLLELLCKIVEYSHVNATVRVEVNEVEKCIEISVENSGINLARIADLTRKIMVPISIQPGEYNRTLYQLSLIDKNGIETNLKAGHLEKPAVNVPAFYAEIRKRLQSHNSNVEKLVSLTKMYNPVDSAFLQKVNDIIFSSIREVSFDSNQLADKLFLSRTQVFRKLKQITAQAPASYIKALRLEKAKNLLETTGMNVGEAAYSTGFESISHFTKVFTKRYGFSPSLLKKNPQVTNRQKDAT